MTLIDKAKLLNTIATEVHYDSEHSLEMYAKMLSLINDAPTVDAVEVVRCKDCRWFENDGFHTNCKIMQFCVESEDYCSRGERREDETD